VKKYQQAAACYAVA